MSEILTSPRSSRFGRAVGFRLAGIGAAVPPREEGVEDARQFRRTDAGAVVEEGPPAEVLKDPAQPRTREFLRRILER